MSASRSNQPETRNPVLALQSYAGLGKLRPELLPSLEDLADLLSDMRRHAIGRSKEFWARNRHDDALYWKCLGVYAGHISSAARKFCGKRKKRAASTEVFSFSTAQPTDTTIKRAAARAIRANTLLAMPIRSRIAAMPAEILALLSAILDDLARDAAERARHSWKTNKGPMAVYWARLASYTRSSRRFVAQSSS